MDFPKDLKYTKEHIWVRVDGDEATIGITDYAQSELGEIVFVELPALDIEVEKDASFCVVESTKTASDIYAPVSGKVSAINNDLESNPNTVNEDPYNAGWIAKITGFTAEDLASLLSADDYEALVK